jgi:hypothetical protein
MTAEKEFSAETREQLTKVRTALLRQHKTLLDFEREGYERERGKIGNSYQFLQLVMSDPWFGRPTDLSASRSLLEIEQTGSASVAPYGV